jgi:hypothetical protein
MEPSQGIAPRGRIALVRERSARSRSFHLRRTRTMKNSALLALGLFTLAGAITISCGGSSEDPGETTTAGKSSTAGSGGSSGSGTAGTGSSTGGSNNPSGGAASNEGGGAPSFPQGGDGPNFPGFGGDGPNFPGGGGDGPNFPGFGGDGPTFPGAGGDGAVLAGCPAAMPTDGSACTRTNANRFGCPYDSGATICRCAGQQGNRTWECDASNGGGGDGPGFGTVTCPENAESGQDCSGFGTCPGQQGCYCTGGEVFCQP